MKKYILCVLSLMILWGCATFSWYYKEGNKAEMARNWDEAIRFYEQALLEDPQNSVYRLALFRAKTAARNNHLYKARNLAAQGQKDQALEEYRQALSYDPENRMILEEARVLKEGERTPEKIPEEKIKSPLELKVSDEKIVLKFIEETDLRSMFSALGKHAGINILFDSQFHDMLLSIDLENMNFLEALNMLCLTSQNFYRIMDENTVLIIPDNPQNRAKYDIVAVRTFYLSNIDVNTIQAPLLQMMRSLSRIPQISVDETLNSITVKDTPEALETAAKLIKLWDKPKGEVIIDLELMEVSRKVTRNLGLSFDSYAIGGKIGTSGDDDTDWIGLDEIDLSKSESYQISLPVGTVQFLESDADTKIIAQPRLRGMQGEKIEYVVGDEVPIPQTVFYPIAAGGVSQQPTTSYKYENVGIEITITPEIHFEHEITLEMDVKIKALGGTGYGDLPIISTREVKNKIRLREGETNLLAGLLKDEERKTLKGIAGLKNLPLIGSLFSNTDQEIQQTDVVLTITPYIIRSIPLKDEDYKPVWMNLEKDLSPGLPYETAREVTFPRREAAAREPKESPEEGQGPEINRITLSPAVHRGNQGGPFQVNVHLSSKSEIQNMSLNLSFDSQVLELTEVRQGTIIQSMGENPSFMENTDNASGLCTIGFSSPDIASGFKGSGVLARLVFKPVAAGDCSIFVSGYSCHSPTGDSLEFTTNSSQITIR